MTKNTQVSFVDERKKRLFDSLKSGKSDEKDLYLFIDRAIDDLKANPYCGIRVPNKQVPKEYRKKYGADKIWKYNLPNAWRLIYTIEADEVTILSVIIEWFNHTEYNRRFNY